MVFHSPVPCATPLREVSQPQRGTAITSSPLQIRNSATLRACNSRCLYYDSNMLLREPLQIHKQLIIHTRTFASPAVSHPCHRRESPPRSHEHSAVNRHVFASLHGTISHRDGAILPRRGWSRLNRPREPPLHRRLMRLS
ncbi:hypothetical protein E2542_SST23934 [Spatholobus suberectus]|nr:hypothetical protein E2542_SST23934 [Spatholobus suberectus]